MAFTKSSFQPSRFYNKMITSSKLLPVHKRFDVVFARGEGAYLFDEQGKKYLDFGAGIAVNALGHCHPKMVEAFCDIKQEIFDVYQELRDG
jgi:acetylornithine/N-succinyldiaminopimelate aminotransferase